MDVLKCNHIGGGTREAAAFFSMGKVAADLLPYLLMNYYVIVIL